jgi:hypothetical protein
LNFIFFFATEPGYNSPTTLDGVERKCPGTFHIHYLVDATLMTSAEFRGTLKLACSLAGADPFEVAPIIIRRL